MVSDREEGHKAFSFYSERFGEDGELARVMASWGAGWGEDGEREELRRVLARVVLEVEAFEAGRPIEPPPPPKVEVVVDGVRWGPPK